MIRKSMFVCFKARNVKQEDMNLQLKMIKIFKD